jgi:hypothetical protein
MVEKEVRAYRSVLIARRRPFEAMLIPLMFRTRSERMRFTSSFRSAFHEKKVRNGRGKKGRLRLRCALDWKLELKEISPNLCA